MYLMSMDEEEKKKKIIYRKDVFYLVTSFLFPVPCNLALLKMPKGGRISPTSPYPPLPEHPLKKTLSIHVSKKQIIDRTPSLLLLRVVLCYINKSSILVVD